jgi:hypothetical protein
MKRLFALALASLFALPACVADELGPEEIEVVEAAVDNNPFEPDPNCHIPGEGIINGTRDGIWCCGMKICNDRELCGEYYGDYIEACGACDWYECVPGSGTESGGGGIRPPIYNPPGGGVYAP